MIHRVLALTLLASAPALAAVPAWSDGVLLAQLSIRERITVRVQKMAPLAAAKPVRWREHKGPKCVAPGDLAGVLISEGNNLDMVMYGGKWLRARLDGQCRTLNFYSGIYLKPGADGRVCADRDVVRARSGAGCAITAFRALEARR
jgi:hypothetical protein